MATHSSILAWKIPRMVDYSLWGRKELDSTGQLHFFLFCVFLLPLLNIFVMSIAFLSFIVSIFACKFPLVSLIFLKRSLVSPILFFSSISLHIVFLYFFACGNSYPQGKISYERAQNSQWFDDLKIPKEKSINWSFISVSRFMSKVNKILFWRILIQTKNIYREKLKENMLIIIKKLQTFEKVS